MTGGGKGQRPSNVRPIEAKGVNLPNLFRFFCHTVP